MPSFYALSKEIKEMNKKMNVSESPGGNGVQTSFKESILKQLPILMQKTPDIREVHIKVSGDGTWCGKRLHLVNVTYTTLNDYTLLMSHTPS